jgi:hypothetical protein
MESPNSLKLKKARHVKSKVKSMIIILFDIKGIALKEFILAGQTVNSAYYCDCMKIFPKLWQQENWLLHHNTPSHTLLLTTEFFTKNNMTVITHPPCFSLLT